MTEQPRPTLAPDRQRPFQIGGWRVEPNSGRLIKGGRSRKLEPKVMELLVFLAQYPGQALTREELERKVWAGTVVGYDALTNAVIKLRKAFGDDPQRPALIETVPKKGYRLIASIVDLDDSPILARGTRIFSHKQTLLGMALVILAAVAITLVLAYFRTQTARVPAIAVLPFTNLSDDPKLAYFSDGIREDIIIDLSKLSGLHVIARTGPGPQLLAAPTTLEAGYRLEGSVRRSGDDIRITVKLINAKTGSHLWTEGYNRRLQDIFSVQTDLTRQIVAALSLSLTQEEKEYIARRDTMSVAAYDLFLQGQARYSRNRRDDNAQARQYFSRALALDNDFTRAHGALALTHADDFRYAWSKNARVSADAALYHAERAVALDASSPQAHWILGFVYLYVRKHHPAAVNMGERAIALDPRNADAHALLAISYLYLGNLPAAKRHIERALLLEPGQTGRFQAALGFAHYFSGSYAEARAALEQSLEQNPVRLLPQLYLAASLNRLGKTDEARWLVELVRTEHPDYQLQTWADRQPFSDPAQRRKIVGDLHRSGLN